MPWAATRALRGTGLGRRARLAEPWQSLGTPAVDLHEDPEPRRRSIGGAPMAPALLSCRLEVLADAIRRDAAPHRAGRRGLRDRPGPADRVAGPPCRARRVRHGARDAG